MELSKIARLRATAQGVARPTARSPADVVRRMLAVQAQEWPSALWAVAMRTRAPRVAAVDRALRSGELVRTWAFRGTLFLLAPEDLSWVHGLVAQRVLRGAAGRHRQLGLDARTFDKAEDVMRSETARGKRRTRRELAEALEAAGVSTKGQRHPHLLFHAAYQGVLVQCGVTKNEPTFRAAGSVLRAGRKLEGDDALAELAASYVTSRGPASARDLAWYAGIPLGDAKRGLALASGVAAVEDTDLWRAAKATRASESGIRMIPAFDELLLAYQDRSASIDARHVRRWTPGGGSFKHVIVDDGRAVGLWTRSIRRDEVRVEPTPFTRWNAAQRAGLREEAERYAEAHGAQLSALSPSHR